MAVMGELSRAERDATARTYTYLRISLIGAVFLVIVSLVFEIGRTGDWLSSISAYYYTPVRSVFVGALVGMGFALIALVGRPGPEDAALNLAGILAPVVAFVPTPRKCGEGSEKCVPPEFLPYVENNIAALLVVGSIALVFTAFTLRRADRWSKWGYLVAILVWLGALVWFLSSMVQGPESSFLRYAHYGAAVPMFAMIIVVAFVNGFRSSASLAKIGRREIRYRPFYKVIAIAMAVGVIIGLVAWLTTKSNDNPPPIVFWVEFGLLVLFGAFWGLQTREFWETGPPPRGESTEG